MCMFIEFGRLGCKHVIYLGDVYVRWFISVLHVHQLVQEMHSHSHDILAQAL